MIISHKNKFIFLKNIKTAGTSLEIALSRFCGKDDVIVRFGSKSQGNYDEEKRKKWGGLSPRNYKKYGFGSHVSAGRVKETLSDIIWDDYYKFAFVRNPWDATISRFFFNSQRKKVEWNEKKFKNFLSSPGGVNSNLDRISINDEIVVDDVFKYENMNEALNILKEKLCLEEDLILPKTKSNYRNHNIHYSHYYDDEAKEIVRQNNKELIKKFDYEFEDKRE